MLTEIKYHNYRVLADATLKLRPFTLIVGPNGSGKSTAVRALLDMCRAPTPNVGLNSGAFTRSIDRVANLGTRGDQTAVVQLAASGSAGAYMRTWSNSSPPGDATATLGLEIQGTPPQARVFELSSDAIAAAMPIKPQVTLGNDGRDVVGVLLDIRDQHPERFGGLVNELQRWLPDYDNLLFGTPVNGQKSFSLRTRVGRHAVPAEDLSQGTLFALALLTIAYLPNPPEIVAIEEPDRGIHPRLLREVRDALYRLAYPESFGESRTPVQVIATTHSPYLVDLFKDHPEEVVLAQKQGLNATLTRLTDQPNWEEIIHDAELGELWYSGVLGGVPVGS